MLNMIKEIQFFGLKEDPFGKLGGAEMYRSELYSLSLNQARQWMRRGEMGCIVGYKGTGKTTLLHDLTAQCAEEGIVLVHVGHPNRPKVSPSAVYDALQMQFADRAPKFRRSTQIRFIELREFLASMKGTQVGVVIDEAHRHTAEFIRAMKEFTEMCYGTRTDLLGVLFSGFPDFLNNIRRSAPDVHKRLMVGRKVIDTNEMMGGEVREYVRHRARIAGNADLFDAGALNALSLKATTPLEANGAAWDAMDTAYKNSSRTVRAEHVTAGMSLLEKKEMLGCTNERIAAKAGVSTSTVSRLLKGDNLSDPEYSEKVERVIDKAVAAGSVEKVRELKAG